MTTGAIQVGLRRLFPCAHAPSGLRPELPRRLLLYHCLTVCRASGTGAPLEALDPGGPRRLVRGGTGFRAGPHKNSHSGRTGLKSQAANDSKRLKRLTHPAGLEPTTLLLAATPAGVPGASICVSTIEHKTPAPPAQAGGACYKGRNPVGPGALGDEESVLRMVGGGGGVRHLRSFGRAVLLQRSVLLRLERCSASRAPSVRFERAAWPAQFTVRSELPSET
jgi:hypothetical protein